MSTPFAVGSLLAGKYRIERILGQGGMGIVVAAEHIQLSQTFALKLMLPEVCAHPEATERFLREARAAVRIQSEHVARVTDVGTLDSGAPYMVMELLQGTDLDEVVRTRGPLPCREAVELLLQACAGVAEAHSLGIVHRDLKPSNLFLTQRRDGLPLVKVLDFGISKALDKNAAAVALTATSTVMGSPLYMSPEQIRSAKDVDARSDVWSLGMILYELLAGVPAFQADSASAVLAMVVADEPLPLRQQRPDVPEALDRAVLTCLKKDRATRFQSVAEFARALAPFAPASLPLIDSISRILGEAPAAVSTQPGSLQPASSQAAIVGSAPGTNQGTALSMGEQVHGAAVTAGPWNVRAGLSRSRFGAFSLAALAAAVIVAGTVYALFGTASSTDPESSVAASTNPSLLPLPSPADPSALTHAAETQTAAAPSASVDSATAASVTTDSPKKPPNARPQPPAKAPAVKKPPAKKRGNDLFADPK